MITLKELAVLGGVSVSTISKALNNADDIALETKAAILTLAKKYGYVKNTPMKHSNALLATGPQIALIYSDVTSRYYSKLLALFAQKISEQNGVMLACDAQFSTQRVVELCRRFEAGGMVDGIICISANCRLEELPSCTIPLTAVSYPIFEAHPFDYVCLNDAMGLEEAVGYLRENGHEAIAYIGEPYTKLRQQAYETAMRKFGLPLRRNLIKISDKRFEEAGYEMMRKLLQEQPLPTAVVCAYDDVAIGASKAICEAGYRIPEDFSLLGVDNTMQTIYDHRTLASVDCHIEEQVDIILTMLSKKIKDPNYRAIQNVSLQTDFIARETVGPCPQAQTKHVTAQDHSG